MDFSKLKNCMEEIVQKYNTPGVDCMVYKDHEVIFRYFTGMSDIENNKKMEGNELYLIFSMTKMLTCTAALQLFEKGKYLMSDPLSKYLPEFEKMKISSNELNMENAAKITTGGGFGEIVKTDRTGYAKKQITIKDLFTMGAGLDYALKDDAINSAINEGKTSTRELVGAMSEKSLGGLSFGLLAGVLWDFATVRGDGFYAVMLTLAGYVAGAATVYLMRNNIFSALILSAGASLFVSVGYWLIFILISGYESAADILFDFYLPSAVYTLAFTAVYYYIVQFIIRLTTDKKQIRKY